MNTSARVGYPVPLIGAQALAAGEKEVSCHFRVARAEDAAVCASLIFGAGAREFRFLLDAPDARWIAFLRLAFASGLGPFSWHRHRVACALDGAVLAVMAAQTLEMTRFDNVHSTWLMLRFFGPAKLPGMLRRGLILKHEQPGPNPGEILITNGAADPRIRSGGIFTTLFDQARVDGWLPMDGKYSCNVLSDNKRARSLYERVGFVEQRRKRPPSPRLPADLVSSRYLWDDRKPETRGFRVRAV